MQLDLNDRELDIVFYALLFALDNFAAMKKLERDLHRRFDERGRPRVMKYDPVKAREFRALRDRITRVQIELMLDTIFPGRLTGGPPTDTGEAPPQ